MATAKKTTKKAAKKEELAPEVVTPMAEAELPEEFDPGFEDDASYEMDEEAKWNYPTMGYNAQTGEWYINEEVYEGSITVQFLALRQSKFQEALDGSIHRFKLRTKKTDMIQGVKSTKHVQFLLKIPELAEEYDLPVFLLGSKSYSTIQAFLNPRSGRYHDERFDVGIWYQLEDLVSRVLEKFNRNVPFYAWNVTISPEEKPFEIKAGDGSGSAKIYRLRIEEPLTTKHFVGAVEAEENKTIIETHDLQEWADTWNKQNTVEEAVEAVEEEEYEDPDNDEDFDEL